MIIISINHILYQHCIPYVLANILHTQFSQYTSYIYVRISYELSEGPYFIIIVVINYFLGQNDLPAKPKNGRSGDPWFVYPFFLQNHFFPEAEQMPPIQITSAEAVSTSTWGAGQLLEKFVLKEKRIDKSGVTRSPIFTASIAVYEFKSCCCCCSCCSCCCCCCDVLEIDFSRWRIYRSTKLKLIVHCVQMAHLLLYE